MSTHINDLANSSVAEAGFYPATVNSDDEGPGVDLGAADGPCFAIQQVGAVGGTSPVLTGRIEESSDNSSWTAISGATFTAVSTSDDLQVIRFTRTKRYVRWAGALTGTSPTAIVAAVIGEQKKTL
jgi:hypothetical protein